MICAEDELGLGTSHEGILILDPAAPVGMPAAEWFNVEEDIVFSIGLTPNRVDAASHLGVARDLVAVANNEGRDEPRTENRANLTMPDTGSFTVTDNSLHIGVTVEDAVACPRYSGLTISGIRVAESPQWLKNRLTAIGLRPINNIVDITNYVLMETGQPLHAFDSKYITGEQVVVKKYPEGTKFTTLDGIERCLTSNDLMISNTSEPMCLAGIFGGIRSGVTAGTTSIFLESAYFDPQHIRKSSKHHSLQTDASFRFERGADPDITVFALKRAALLIGEIAGGYVTSDIVDVCPKPFPARKVYLSFRNLDRLAGKTLDRGVVKSILTDIGIQVSEKAGPEPGLDLDIPGYKVDVTREADVIEEILRIYGYNNIKPTNELKASISYARFPDPGKIQNMISDYFASNGFNEIMNNSLSRSAWYHQSKDYPENQCVRILNPLSRDLDVMRQNLLFGVLETIAYNQNRKNPDLKIFEFGNVYSTRHADADPVSGYHEEKHLAIAITGRAMAENWNAPDGRVDFYQLKGFVEGLLTRISVHPDQFDIQPVHSELVNDGLNYSLNGQEIIVAGQVNGQLLKSFDCRQAVLYADIRWDRLLELIPVKGQQYQGIPKFPEVRRDLALVVDRHITFARIREQAFQAEKGLLKRIGLFDVYEGDKIDAGKKSYAISFILQSDERTLTDKDIERSMDRILKAMTTAFDARLR
jgi:phenylalanyl-tRNA synthetase beta chain